MANIEAKCPICKVNCSWRACDNCSSNDWKGYFSKTGNEELVWVVCNVCSEYDYPPILCGNCNKKIHAPYWKSTGCFVATAVFNDYEHFIVKDLRMFRDNWLEKHVWGISFIKWYYRISPKLADIISNYKVLRVLSFLLIIKPLHLTIKFFRLNK